MSSYFDDANTKLSSIFEAHDPGSKVPDGEQRWTFFWKRYHAWENKLIEDCLGATRARRFPPELAGKIKLIIARERVFSTSRATELNERASSSLLSMRTSFLSSALHSAFHEVATWGSKNRVRHLNDNPEWLRKRAPKERT